MDTNSPELFIDRSRCETTVFTLTVPRLKGMELHKAVKAASKMHSCTMGEAFLAMLEQNITTEVTLNLYKAVDPQPGGVFAEDHWLSDVASRKWLAKVTHLAAPGYTATKSYQPTELLRASVTGRDGHCRFPGCDVPGYACDVDHVHRHANGGATTTAKLSSVTPIRMSSDVRLPEPPRTSSHWPLELPMPWDLVTTPRPRSSLVVWRRAPAWL